GIESIIPAKIGRPSASLPTGAWRALMATEFDDEIYGQRWQSETVMYMIKQHQGESLTAHRYQSRRREMGLMAVTHNVMIVSPDKRFYNALPTLLFRPSVCAGQPSKKPPSMAAWRDQIVEQICTRSLRRCRTRYRLRWPRRISSQD